MTILIRDPRVRRLNRRMVSRKRDKLSTWARRNRRSKYSCPVDRTSGVPDIGAFAKWVERVVEHFRTESGWSVSKIAREAGIGRAMLYRWMSGDNSQGAPTRDTVARFCDNLRVPRDEPFEIFGWVADGPKRPGAPTPLPKMEDPDLLAIQAILDKHGVKDDDVFMIRSILRSLRERYSTNDSDDERAAG